MRLYKEFATEEILDRFSDLDSFLKEANFLSDGFSMEELKQPETRLRMKQLVGTAIELYGEKNILALSMLKGWLTSQDTGDLLSFASRTGTKIPRQQKGSKNKRVYIIRKILNRWFSRGVQSGYELVLEGYRRGYQKFRSEFEEWTPEKADFKVFNYTDKYLEFFQPLCEDKDRLLQALRRTDLYFVARAVGDDEGADYVLTLFEDLEFIIYEKYMLDALAFYLLAEEKRRQTDLEVQNAELRNTLSSSMWAANLQLDEALKMLQEKDKEIQQLLVECEELKQRIQTYKKLLNRGTLESEMFEGKRVLVLGHPVQRDMYEEEITVRGGTFEFIPAVADQAGFNELEGAVNRADIILYIRTYSSHSVLYFIRSRTSKDNVHVLNCYGRDSFVSELRRIFGGMLSTYTAEKESEKSTAGVLL